MRRISTLLLIVGCVSVGAPGAVDRAAAAGPPTERFLQQDGTVPEEFIRAIVGFDAELIVGDLPPELAAAITLPEGARVIGSVVGEPLTMAYLQVPGDAETVIGFFREQLLSAGWRTPPERTQRRGFQAPPSPVRSGDFCSPANAYLDVTAGFDELGTTRLYYYAVFPRELPCDRPAQSTQGLGGAGELRDRTPVLILPEDEIQGPGRQGTSYAAGRESYTSTVELHSERNAAEIAAGIAAQVEAEGWVPELANEDEATAVRTWSQTFDDGIEVLGSLTVVEVTAGFYEVFFRIRMPPDAQPRRPFLLNTSP